MKLDVDDMRPAPPEPGAAGDGAGVIERIERQMAAAPERPALLGGGGEGSLSYGELDRRSALLARALRARGLGPDRLVAIVADRGPAAVVAMVAVLRGGGGYVPIDPQQPRERISLLLRETDPVAVLSRGDRLGGGDRIPIAGERIVSLTDEGAWSAAADWQPCAPPPPDSAAYVIYTSGSTGTPKGVLISRRGFDAQLSWMQERYRLEPHDRFLQLSWLMFDFSVIEVFWPLMVGGAVVLPRPGGELDVAYLGRLIRETGTTAVHFVPSLLRVLLEEADPEPWRGVTRVFSGGEALPADLARRCRRVFPGAELHNQYGPTETTINATAWQVEAAPAAVPIGHAVASTSLFVLDANLDRVPPGAAGELYIGGVQLARGYLRRPAETAQRFVPGPGPLSGAPGERLYRTGDLVRMRGDGALEYIGRNDDQVKVRGFRIELGEVEVALCAHPSIGEAVCSVRDDGGGAPRLVAYVKWRGGERGEDLDAHLRARLPAYMVPALHVTVDRWPLTPGGKLDRAALPAPSLAGAAGDTALAPIESEVAAVWSEVLGIEVGGAAADFFQLGGDSLAAMRMMIRLDRAAGLGGALGVGDLITRPRLRDFAALVEQARAGAPAPAVHAHAALTPVARDRALPLSSAQEGLWILEQLDPGVYRELTAFHLAGPLDADRLRRCLAAIVRRHEVLRSAFVAADGAPAVRLLDPTQDWMIDMVSIAPPDDSGVLEAARREAERQFDLERGPLVRFVCVPLARRRHILLCYLHHLVSDGVSESILLSELAELYAADAEAREARLPPLAVQYADYAAWQRRRLTGERRAELIARWRRELDGAPPVLDLPADFPRPERASHRAERHRFDIPAAATDDLRRLGRQHGATLFMTLLGLFQALLSRYTGERDIVVGTPVSLRDREELEPLIGLFINTLPIRLRLDRDTTCAALLRRVRRAVADAFAGRDLPFDELVAALAPRRDPARHPIFQVGFVFDVQVPGARAGDLEIAPTELAVGACKFDLSLRLAEQDDHVAGVFEYATDLFSAATVQQLARHFVALAAQACRAPDRPLARIDLMDAGERSALVERPARQVRWHRAPPSTVARIEEQMRREPDRVAVLAPGDSLSYGELDRRSALLAGELRALGLGPDRLVAMVAERSPGAVVAMVAALRAGGGYVPISPRLPRDRIAHVIRETAPVATLCPAELHQLAGAAAPAPVLDLTDEDRWSSGRAPVRPPTFEPAQPPAGALAYVIYTSGSTGAPKGVMVPRRGLDAQLSWMQEQYRLEPYDRFLQLSSLMFDFSVIEVFWPLMTGGAVVLPRPDGELDLDHLGALVRETGATAVHFVPSMLRVLLEEADLCPWRSVTRVFSGGEALSADLARRCAQVFPGAELHNQYGPTETAINATFWQVEGGGDGGAVPIGRAVADTSLFVLDENLMPAPRGATGELFIGGVQLARGYTRRPAETAQRFVPSPLAAVPGERLYRTGDLVRMRADGALDYIGRNDHQVKLRGYRIELDEVEGAIRSHAAVRQAACAVVGDRGEADRRLVAYIQWQGGAHLDFLDDHLGRLLPDYMVPSVYVAVERWPLTVGGKLDRAALPPPTFEDGGARGDEVAVEPMTQGEQLVAAIWSELLGVEIRSPLASFFELGGTSLQAMRATARLNRATGRNLPFLALFQARTVRRTAELLVAGDGAAHAHAQVPALPPLAPRSDRTGWPLTFSQRMAWELTHRGRQSAFELPRRIFEIAGPLDRDVLRRAVEAVLARHPVLRARFAVEHGQLVQTVAERAAVDWRELDAPPGGGERARPAVLADMAAHLDRPFDLGAGPVIRFAVASAGRVLHWFGFSVHHIAFDGGSMAPFLADLSRAYRAIARTGAASWDAPAIELADVAAWDEAVWRSAGPAMAGFWRDVLDGAVPPPLPMSGWSGANDLLPDRAVSCSFSLGGDSLASLRRLAAALGSTPFIVALTSLGATCRALTGVDDCCIASPYLRRDVQGTEQVVGYLSHPLLLRLDWPASASFSQAAAHTGERTLSAYQHGHLPLSCGPDVVPGLPSSRALASESLFRVFFNYLDVRRATPDLGPGLDISAFDVDEPEARAPLMIYAVEGDDALTWSLLAQARCYDETALGALAARIADDLRRLLAESLRGCA